MLDDLRTLGGRHVKWMVNICVYHAREIFSTVMVSMWKEQSAT